MEKLVTRNFVIWSMFCLLILFVKLDHMQFYIHSSVTKTITIF
jgi:hypothetical protein